MPVCWGVLCGTRAALNCLCIGVRLVVQGQLEGSEGLGCLYIGVYFVVQCCQKGGRVGLLRYWGRVFWQM